MNKSRFLKGMIRSSKTMKIFYISFPNTDG